jgi:phage FluMu protein gp41
VCTTTDVKRWLTILRRTVAWNGNITGPNAYRPVLIHQGPRGGSRIVASQGDSL